VPKIGWVEATINQLTKGCVEEEAGNEKGGVGKLVMI